MKILESTKGRWPEIFAHYELPPITGNRAYSGPCPICGKKGKFRIDNKFENGNYICVCGAGNGLKLLELTQGRTYHEICRELNQLLGLNWTNSPVHDERAGQREKIIQKLYALPTLRGTPGEEYLHSRGIYQLPKHAVKFSDSEFILNTRYNALFSLATDENGNACYLHTTYLDGARKAVIDAPKILTSLRSDNYLKYADGIAIRLFDVASTLAIAEGIETALSVYSQTGCSTWSTINTTFMSRFRVPSGVEKLYIYADTDSTAAGHKAAFECAHRNLIAKNDLHQVIIKWPENGDFNDILLSPAKVYQWQFKK